MLEHYRKAFKAYDIRGTYGKEIDELLVYTMGIAIANYSKKNFTNPTILIWSDVRNQNIWLISAFIAGLKEQWITNISCARTCNTIDEKIYPYGICSSPWLYYLGQGDVDISVEFTASHNPPEDVGMKFFDKNCTFLSQQTLLDLFDSTYDPTRTLPSIPFFYTIPSFWLLEEKKRTLLEFLGKKLSNITKPFRFAVDFSTGAGVAWERELLQQLIPADQLFLINDYADGNFSAHLSETQDHENYIQLIDQITSQWLDFWIMFDGDADRIGFVWPDGRVIWWDMILTLVAEQIILEHSDLDSSKKLILYEVMCSQIIPEIVNTCWWTSKMVRMGRFFIKEAMENYSALFAWETSGHFMFADIWNYEMPLLVLYYILKSLEHYWNRESMMKHISKYYKTPVYSVVVENKEIVLSNIKKYFSSYKQIEIDGISVYWNDFWFNVRASNTESKLRYCVEANNKKQAEDIIEELKRLFIV